MMGMFVEPLFLDKSVNTPVLVHSVFAKHLTQAERDGIRFLYRHFKKNNNGVIMSDSKYSTFVQEILFIQSLGDTLSEPCLVLVDEDRLNYWKELSVHWYENKQDLIFIPTNIFSNKKLFVILNTDLPSAVCRRDWAVVVIDDINDKNMKLTKRNLQNIRANFFICNTSKDIKSNPDYFESIYKCIDTKGTFDMEEHVFEPLDEGISQPTRYNFDRNIEDLLTPMKNIPVLTSKKNKDPTGTKVKSSKKRKLNDNNELLTKTTENTVNNKIQNANSRNKDSIEFDFKKEENVDAFNSSNETDNFGNEMYEYDKSILDLNNQTKYVNEIDLSVNNKKDNILSRNVDEKNLLSPRIINKSIEETNIEKNNLIELNRKSSHDITENEQKQVENENEGYLESTKIINKSIEATNFNLIELSESSNITENEQIRIEDENKQSLDSTKINEKSMQEAKFYLIESKSESSHNIENNQNKDLERNEDSDSELPEKKSMLENILNQYFF